MDLHGCAVQGCGYFPIAAVFAARIAFIIQNMRKDAEELIQLYIKKYEPLALRSRRPNTRRLYRSTLKFFEQFLERTATTDDLTDDDVSAFAAWRLGKGLAKRTVNKDLFNLLAIWRWLHKKSYVETWPDVSLESPPDRTPVALMADEVDKVLQAIVSEKSPVGNFAGPAFWLALFLVIWDTAERIGAVMDLTWDRVDMSRGWVRFDAEDRKGARADNMLPIAPDTIAALAKLRGPGEGKVFKWPYCDTYIYRKLGRIMKRAGLPDNRLYKFHVLRKSVASHYEAAGGNATELLGHSSRKVTKAYLDPRITKKTSAIDLLFRPGGLDDGGATDGKGRVG